MSVFIYCEERKGGRKEGRKTKWLPLEAKTKAETVEQKNETMSETVEQS